MTVLDLLQLNDPQTHAATAGGHVVVTAGAGSGKTRTLVGRYLALLEDGVPLRSIAAITFTDKAAREMRTRIRRAIADWLAQEPPGRAFWEASFADLDAARIGTIHSLCAQILRAHPAEAARLGVMPGFEVLEEGRAAVLRSRAVEEGLAWAADDDVASHLFRLLGEFGLRTAVSTLLEKRLDADAAFERMGDDPLRGWGAALESWLSGHLDGPAWGELLDTLSGLRASDPTDKLESARQAVIAHAEAAGAARRQGDLGTALAELAALRAATALTGRKANWPGDTLQVAKEAMRALRGYFDERLKPLADPKRLASRALDEQTAGMIWALHATYRHVLEVYAQARRTENVLDFDDLEACALALLDDPVVRATWQASVRAVLVDEFQDTNERQRQIVYALTGFAQRETGDTPPGSPGTLFVVGDAKQSIYRFRGADVAVFGRVQADIKDVGGRSVALDLTFRAHRDLVEMTNRLLAPILGEDERPGRPYLIPFAPLTAHRPEPQPGVDRPFVEFLLGLGESASAGRQAAAEGLAARLLELRDREGIEWKDVALLFRASTAFPVYEDALEQAGVPFVTVAGRGFYERSEVRQLLNALSAVVDPADDLALAGFLRSPFVALTDVALYMLRFPPTSIAAGVSQAPRALWAALNDPALPEIVTGDDLTRALRARDLIAELHDLAGRVPVATLLKLLLDRTHYRAALQAVEGGARARRNVDKLLADAHTSGLVSVREFAEYVRTLRDVGARESEAPTEAGSAVQLMTVHKAKGLEFPVVVIADAAHAGRRGTERVLLDGRMGVTIDLRDEENRHPAAHLLAALWDSERDEAEDRRLLYVAATRAREKLLVSAHTKILKGGALQMSGWLGRLGRVAGLDEVPMGGMPVEPMHLALSSGVGCWVYPWREERPVLLPGAQPAARDAARDLPQDLVAPLVLSPTSLDVDGKQGAHDAQPPRRVWRVVPRTGRPHAPAWVVGTLTHAALRHWRFAEEGLEPFLRPLALEVGIVDPDLLHASIVEVTRMLRRFRAHPLWAELNAAQRWHEVPFSVAEDGRPENGVIDLLYRVGGDYRIAEFKTDRLGAEGDLRAHIRQEGYDEQVRRYLRAVRLQLGVEAEASWVFMNVGNQVVVMPAP
jgi:ATP-dependent helicase/nuclease subunit A